MKRLFFVLTFLLALVFTPGAAASDDTGMTFSDDTVYIANKVIPAPLTVEAVISVPFDMNDECGVIVGNYTRGNDAPYFSFEMYFNGVPRIYINNKGDCTDGLCKRIFEAALRVEGQN